MRTVRDPKTGRTYQARRRGVSNGSIRKALDAAERVLRDARQRGVLATPVPDLKAAAPKAERPRRSFLELEQIAAIQRAADLIEAEHRGLTWEKVGLIRRSNAPRSRSPVSSGVSDTLVRKVRRGELWNDGRARNRNDVPRASIVDALILTGLRVSELCGLDAAHVDLAGARVRFRARPPRPTPASACSPLLPAAARAARRAPHGPPGAATEPAFPTRNGTRQHPDNVRARILAPIRVKAPTSCSRPTAAADRAPHAAHLRRTFASILAVCDVPPRRAMYLLGHTDPTLTLAVYQQVLDLGRGVGRDARAAARRTLAEARTRSSAASAPGPGSP